MFTKVLTILAIVTIAKGNDVIVGLKTDGKKIFDENRQANPALWRQMDNVTIKAPENEVIRRVVITDLRPDKDGDVKIVEGGEGQKNVTIELKSPTVLRGYEFHIEVYSAPEENVPFTNDQQSTTEIIQDGSTQLASTNSPLNSDTTSKIPDLPTDKNVPAILSSDETKDSERQGRNAKNDENSTTECTLTSTTFKSDISTTPVTQYTESSTENGSAKSSDTPNKFENDSTTSQIPLNWNFNNNPAIPALNGKDIVSDKFNTSGNEETRQVHDTQQEQIGKAAEEKINDNPTKVGFESSTENKEATTTEMIDAIPVEEKSEDNSKETADTSEFDSFNNRKYTSVITSKIEHPGGPIPVKDAGKLRNVRGAEEKVDESETTTISVESTTVNLDYETSTVTGEDCITTEPTKVENPANIGKDNYEGRVEPIPIYLNNRQWDQRFNNPTFQRGDDQNSPGIKVHPAVLTDDQSTVSLETQDAEHFGNDFKSSPDHMESQNPKITEITSPNFPAKTTR